MLFNTFQFATFFAAVVAVHFALPQKYRWVLLLLASYYFYMCWNPPYVLVIMLITGIDYAAARGMASTSNPTIRRNLLFVSLGSNLGLLFAFKYFNFAIATTSSVLASFRLFPALPYSELLLPIGLSFHTFQAISYTVEVYRRKVAPERHLGIYALYVAFFPQLVAGPIERPYNLLPQFRRATSFDPARVQDGLKLIAWGLFKKAVVADLISVVVNTVYANPRQFSGLPLIVATAFFSIQIYCDFSGYSDMAVGIARILGYNLTINFRQPYMASSITDFWHRWHISLSTWFRDYVYIPLGGNRTTLARWCFNIMLVFLASGLWHGANWTFLVWGALNGAFLILERAIVSVTSHLNKMTRWTGVGMPAWCGRLATMLAVTLAWVWFRAASVQDALYIYSHMLSIKPADLSTLWVLGLPRFEMGLACSMILVVLLVDYLQANTAFVQSSMWAWRPVRWATYAACTYAIVFFGVFERIQFIYFQF